MLVELEMVTVVELDGITVVELNEVKKVNDGRGWLNGAAFAGLTNNSPIIPASAWKTT